MGRLGNCTEMMMWRHGLVLLQLKIKVLQCKKQTPLLEGYFQPLLATQRKVWPIEHPLLLAPLLATIDVICE